MEAAIISVGNELLMGKTLNTNLTFIAKALRKLGIEVTKASCVKDDVKDITKTLEETQESLIVFTGGLGPTADDLTKETVCDYFGFECVLHEATLDRITQYFKRLDRVMSETNNKQAYFPKDAIVLTNKVGTAPGAIFTKEDKTIILLPGPPSELIPMFDLVHSYLESRVDTHFYEEGFRVVSIGESELETTLRDFYKVHKDVNIAPYAGLGEIEYIFTSKSASALEKALDAFKSAYEPYIVGSYKDTLESRIVHILAAQEKTISFAESCTAGMAAARLVNVPDASKVFNESTVLYSNESKTKQLGVNQMIMDKFGAVSDQCVYELAYHLASRTDANITLSISGIAGPSGGTALKPVGTVYFGVSHEGVTKTYHRVFSGDRQMIREKATTYGLHLVYKTLVGQDESHD